MEVLDDRCFAIVGGGGRMKSGIPNACVRLYFLFVSRPNASHLICDVTF